MGRKEALMGADSVSMQFDRHKVNDAQLYNVCYNTDDLTASSNADVIFQSGTNPAHLRVSGAGSGAFKFFMYENPTASTVGTSLVINNMDRQSANTCTALSSHTPTLSTVGTLLVCEFAGAATPTPLKLGADVRECVEWKLQTSTNYLIRITNTEASTQTANINLNFYEG